MKLDNHVNVKSSIGIAILAKNNHVLKVVLKNKTICIMPNLCDSIMQVKQALRYDLPNGLTYLQLGRDFINLFFFKYMPF